VRLVRARDAQSWKRIQGEIAAVLISGQRQQPSQNLTSVGNEQFNYYLFVELHGSVPGLFDLHIPIRRWRQQSRESGVPIFAFATLRKPTHFQVSYFLHFHSPRCKWAWCERQLYAPTEPNLIRTAAAMPNGQCRFLVHGQVENKEEQERAIRHDDGVRQRNVTGPECRLVQNLLRSDWDWVGTTERLSTHTLPLLTQLLAQNASLANDFQPRNARDPRKVPLSVHELHRGTMRQLEELSRHDLELYRAIRAREDALQIDGL